MKAPGTLVKDLLLPLQQLALTGLSYDVVRVICFSGLDVEMMPWLVI